MRARTVSRKRARELAKKNARLVVEGDEHSMVFQHEDFHAKVPHAAKRYVDSVLESLPQDPRQRLVHLQEFRKLLLDRKVYPNPVLLVEEGNVEEVVKFLKSAGRWDSDSEVVLRRERRKLAESLRKEALRIIDSEIARAKKKIKRKEVKKAREAEAPGQASAARGLGISREILLKRLSEYERNVSKISSRIDEVSKSLLSRKEVRQAFRDAGIKNISRALAEGNVPASVLKRLPEDARSAVEEVSALSLSKRSYEEYVNRLRRLLEE